MTVPDLAADLGRKCIDLLARLGHATLFFVDLARHMFASLRRPYLTVAQVHAIGNRSLIIIAASGAAVGLVLALQGHLILSRYGQAESLGLLVALSLVRELGPVLTALLYAGRAGTSLTAEIGLMKAGEQLVAMEMMAVDPRVRVLAPRFLAGMLAMPMLGAVFSAVGILASYVVGVLMIGVDEGQFWSQMQDGTDVIKDVGNGVIKTLVFGVATTFIALYVGYESKATPEGVALATTRTVVISSLTVLFLDFVLTALMFTTP
jgi:phospholipid/cholesterol/gamma-HCH transport system permease protein